MINIRDIQNQIQNIQDIKDTAEYISGFLKVYGIPNATISRLGITQNLKIDTEIVIGTKLICVYTSAMNLYAEYDTFQRKKNKDKKYRFVILINEKSILSLDTHLNEWLSVDRDKLDTEFEFFLPIAGIEKTVITEKKNINIKIGEKFAQLYNEILLLNNDKDADAGNLLVNLVCAMFCDSCGMIKSGSLYNLFNLYSGENAEYLNELLSGLFAYIKGASATNAEIKKIQRQGIVRGVSSYTSILTMNNTCKSLILSLCELNWNSVEPEALGAIIQTILNPANTAVAYNYTSTANVYKVIGPLFIDDLYSEYEKLKKSEKLDLEFLNHIEEIQVFDPACGTGNFLMVCYKELKKLEILVKEYLTKKGILFENKEYVRLINFYGIEQNSIATEICRMGLAFTEKKFVNDIVNVDLPVDNVVNGNALFMDWKAFCINDKKLTYIVGNPSYKGAHSLSPEQQREMNCVFAEENAKGFKHGELDYASAYFYKATVYLMGTQGGFAFVTTNSLTQGIHVPTLWPLIFSKGICISFAHTSFKWKNEGRNTTAVTVVIIGCRTNSSQHTKTIYDGHLSYETEDISPYLTKGGVIVGKENAGPICSWMPKMIKGNMPYNTELLLLSAEEKKHMISEFPESEKFLMRVVGTDEFIYAKERWCLWIQDDCLEQAMEIPPIAERIEKVKEARLASKDKTVNRMAARAHQFREMNMPERYSLVVPSVTLEKRPYLQIGYLGYKYVVTNLAFVIYDAEPWVFGLIASKMHNLWIKTICGGLETRIRYSNVLGYNTFPAPQLSEEQKKAISEAALGVIVEREVNSEKNLVELYNEDTMPTGLRCAHKILDEVVESCYKPEGFFSDQERIDEMFLLYRKIKEAK